MQLKATFESSYHILVSSVETKRGQSGVKAFVNLHRPTCGDTMVRSRLYVPASFIASSWSRSTRARVTPPAGPELSPAFVDSSRDVEDGEVVEEEKSREDEEDEFGRGDERGVRAVVLASVVARRRRRAMRDTCEENILASPQRGCVVRSGEEGREGGRCCPS